MADTLLELVQQAMASPWVYAALFVMAALDAVLPAVPSETAVITAGVFAAGASGQPELPLVAVAAAAGAFVGDHVSYAIGRSAGPRLLAASPPGTRRRKALDWAAQGLHRRGGLVLVVARYVPGGRTAVTVTAGAVAFPRRSFTPFAALAASLWGLYCALVGYVGGVAFEREPLHGVLLGIGLALAVTIVIEGSRFMIVRRRSSTLWMTPGDKSHRCNSTGVNNPVDGVSASGWS